MLATVAALVILLGLMVSLARYVRRQASDQLTEQLLSQLDSLLERYQARYRALPAIPEFVGRLSEAPPPRRSACQPGGPVPLLPPPGEDDGLPDETVLQRNAAANNRALVLALQVEARRYPSEFAEMPQSFFTDGTLPDAWGTPIVFMPALHPAVGMAMENRPFFLSAGPDRRFSSLEDNLYSYEVREDNLAAPGQSGDGES
jgi:hypothetical protein